MYLPRRSSSPLTETASALPLENYAGVYSNPAYGKFVVTKAGGKLSITMGPRKIKAKLVRTESNADKFLAYLPDYPDGYEMVIPICFKFPSSGPAVLVTGPIIHDPEEVFTRTGN
jgi:hypothetical protein